MAMMYFRKTCRKAAAILGMAATVSLAGGCSSTEKLYSIDEYNEQFQSPVEKESDFYTPEEYNETFDNPITDEANTGEMYTIDEYNKKFQRPESEKMYTIDEYNRVFQREKD